MELLNPSSTPCPGFSPESRSGFSSPAIYGRGFGRKITSELREVVEEDVNNTVHVATGNFVEKEMMLLNWTFKRFEGIGVRLLHVHQPTHYIPTLLGKLPASQASPEVVSTYRKHEKEQTLKLLQTYSSICSAAKVDASIIVIEADEVKKGIVDLVYKHGIKKLVIGGLPENCMKVRNSSSKANYVAKNAPLFCEIFFISKGKHIWTRSAFEGQSYLPLYSSPQLLAVESSRSSQCSQNKSIHPYCPRSNLDKSAVYDEIRNRVWRHELDSSPALSFSTGTCFHDLFGSLSATGCSTSSERMAFPDSDFKLDEETLYGDFMNAKIEIEMSRNEAHADLLKHKRLELVAREAISKAKEFESSLKHEVKLRNETEDALRTVLVEQEKISQEREGITQELHRVRRDVALLESWVQEANQSHDVASGELKLVHESIATLTHEKQEIRRQKMEAMHWLERWVGRGHSGSTKRNSPIGFFDEIPELAEFSLSDLQSATCNFSESFKIGQGGYGCIYKGEMLGRTVAIRKLHPHNVQGESEFQQEVKVLGKLQHPHLVSLLGVCPEAWSIVYEYLPNGNLQDNLIRKSNLLTWKIRAQIIADIASALCFLHSTKPEKVVFGNLTPRKILLDSTLSCKISDFGICKLITEDSLHCPSMRWSAGPNPGFPYTDPEFQRIGILTTKSDVYSFGLIILQLLTRRPPVGLVGEVRKGVSSGKLGDIFDSTAGEWPTFVVRRLVGIALQCCELNGRDRPDVTPSLVMELKQLHLSVDRPVPSFFLCPILQEIMHDPEVAADGFTYEGEAMRAWLENGKHTSPMTNLKLAHLNLTPNHAIRLAIQGWLCKA